MAEPKTEQEPSIEEILESIRQIISDDTEAAPAASGPDLAVKKTEAPAPVMTFDAEKAPQDKDVVVDLTDVIPAAIDKDVEVDMRPVSDSSVQDAGIDFREPVRETRPQGGAHDMAETPPEMAADQTILSENTADAATAAMARLLASNVAVERDEPARVGRVTLEDLAREMMRPMIKTWLDQNLPRVIEKIVAREVEKLSRRALDQ